MRGLSSSAGIVTSDVSLCRIMYIRLVVLPLEQFQGLSSARVAGYQQIIYVFKELKLKLIIIRDDQAVPIIQAVSASFIFTQRNLFKASNAILNQLKRLLDKFVIQIFVDYNLFNRSISYFKDVYYKVFSISAINTAKIVYLYFLASRANGVALIIQISIVSSKL